MMYTWSIRHRVLRTLHKGKNETSQLLRNTWQRSQSNTYSTRARRITTDYCVQFLCSRLRAP
eukprot:7111964-Pyramimonas_sp.AAC.1